ncbi:MAG TPA: oxidoreductase [Dehalococcoidia bacterium]|nr:oxidoreductase [Dehalococcoidia bacterium]
MADYGILVDFTYCSGCHACEVACKQEHHIASGKVSGVIITELVQELPGNKLDITYLPFFTKVCFFCAPRVKEGKLPACVKHCMANCLKFGRAEELAKEVPQKGKRMLYTMKMPF